MSMISAQVDELRELATRYDELQAGAVKAVTMPSDMGSILREAADTILSLRDKAQELQAENAKLRERIHELEMEGSDHFYRTAYAEDANRTLEAENAKLRELVRDMWGCISHIGEYDVFYYDMAKDGCGIDCTVNGEHCCADKLYYRMRELGVDE